MNTISKILLPIALLFACDTEDMEDAESNEVAVASSNHEGEGRRGRGGPMRLDTDNDGAISLAEAQGHPLAGKFIELDADNDGKLSRDELHAMRGRHGKRGPKDPAERAADFVQKFDADKNGSISAAEVEGRPWLADKFAELDADRDGKLSTTEVQAMKPRHHGEKGHGGDPGERAAHFVQKFDADKDGTISASEVAEHPRLADKFAELDADKDGKLNTAELQAMRPPRYHGGKGHSDPAERAALFMTKADVDANGSLSTAEVAEHPMFADKFAEIDSDGDGALSMAELSAFKPAPRSERGFGHRGDRQGRNGETNRG